MIELKNLSKSYQNGKVKAVRHLDLTVKPGDVFGFLGPNGAGKSTTIKMMVGLLQSDNGSIQMNGIDISWDPLGIKKIIGYVPDEPILYDKMRGSAFLAFIADIFEVPGEKREKIKNLAKDFELSDALDDLISSYSHGMKQKLSIIAALLHDPEIFILDEPIVGLDPRSSFLLKEKMRRHAEEGKTVFFSTHVMEVAEKLCDRVGIIHHGRMIAVGPLEELKTQSRNSHDSLEQLFLELTDENV
ncbi:MAG: ABC transporter ATP-binding protein [Spirochaetales bacterium]|nr:ABC transporter ATP-binding protein [Spirochaetales bacterium]